MVRLLSLAEIWKSKKIKKIMKTSYFEYCMT